MGWNEEPNPLLTLGGEAELNTSASMSTNGAGFGEAEDPEGDVKPRRSVLWLLVLCVEWLPTEFNAGLFRSLGVAESFPAVPGSATRPGFFFFKIAKMEDSRSGKGGISSRTVACEQIRIMSITWKWLISVNEPNKPTKTSVDATMLSWRYSDARCWSSASALRRLLSALNTSCIRCLISGNKLTNLT